MVSNKPRGISTAASNFISAHARIMSEELPPPEDGGWRWEQLSPEVRGEFSSPTLLERYGVISREEGSTEVAETHRWRTTEEAWQRITENANRSRSTPLPCGHGFKTLGENDDGIMEYECKVCETVYSRGDLVEPDR